ncbi:VCBS domain-containing protein, partial [Vibrio cyclitrophicus]
TSVDGTEQVVKVTINGTNDAATIAGDTEVVASETDAALSLSGTLTATDVDNADNTFTATSIEGTNGTFSIAENGEWTFVANSAFNEMNVGDSSRKLHGDVGRRHRASRESDDQWHERCGDDRRRHRGRGL